MIAERAASSCYPTEIPGVPCQKRFGGFLLNGKIPASRGGLRSSLEHHKSRRPRKAARKSTPLGRHLVVFFEAVTAIAI